MDTLLGTPELIKIKTPLALPEYSANPLGHYISFLVLTETVKNLAELLNYFPKEANVDNYIKLVVNDLECRDIIEIQDGQFILKSEFFRYPVTKDHLTLYPHLFSTLAERVITDTLTNRVNTEKEATLIYCFPNNPDVSTKLRALTIYMRNELQKISEESQGAPSNGVRMVGLVNASTLPEDFAL